MPENVRDAIVEDVFQNVGAVPRDDARKLFNDMETKKRMQIEAW